MNDEIQGKPKRICKHEGCTNELIGRQLKFCDAHSAWAKQKKTGPAITKKKTAKPAKTKGGERIKVRMTIETFILLMKKANNPHYEIHITPGD